MFSIAQVMPQRASGCKIQLKIRRPAQIPKQAKTEKIGIFENLVLFQFLPVSSFADFPNPHTLWRFGPKGSSSSSLESNLSGSLNSGSLSFFPTSRTTNGPRLTGPSVAHFLARERSARLEPNKQIANLAGPVRLYKDER